VTTLYLCIALLIAYKLSDDKFYSNCLKLRCASDFLVRRVHVYNCFTSYNYCLPTAYKGLPIVMVNNVIY